MSIATKLVRGIFNRRLWVTLSCVLMVLFASISINAIGVRLLGNVDGWERWLDAHKHHFFLWRLCLYGVTGYGWWWMRRRVLLREPDAPTRSRLHRTELAAGLAIIVLEATTWLQPA